MNSEIVETELEQPQVEADTPNYATEAKTDNIAVNKDFKLSKEGTVKPKVHRNKLPNVILNNLELLKNITKFLDKNCDGDVETRNPDNMDPSELEDLTKEEIEEMYDEYEELKEIQELLDEFCDALEAHNNEQPFLMTRVASKMNKLIKLTSSYI